MDFDYTQFPKNYTLCPNTECPRAGRCLRQALYNNVPASITYLTILSPAASRQLAGGSCPHFRPIQLVRFARGIDALLAQLRKFPYDDAVLLRREMYEYFGKNKYYEIKNRKRLVTPEEQEEILSFFRKRGIAECPLYDEYIVNFDYR